MKRFKQMAIAAIGALLMMSNATTASAQNVDLTKYPDWRAPETIPQKTMPHAKARGAARSMNIGPRPDHINNALSMYFPPVFNQSGGSCGSAQAIGYMFTHEMNSWRNKDASFEENQYPSHFTWLFTTAGVEKIEQMVHNGIPNVTTYGGRTYSNTFGYQVPDNDYFGWMQGYDKWYAAMFNRSKEFFRGPVIVPTDENAVEQLKQWLWNRWGTEGYNDGGVAGFGVASGGTWGKVPKTATNDAIGATNMYCVAKWGKTYDHGLTICGYDDRIEFDLDSNGVYGEPGKNETGAWIICNSWGETFCDKGFIYCPYQFSYCVFTEQNTRYLNWATELYIHRPDFEPQRTIKLLMDYDHRWELSLSAGIAQDTAATKPEATCNFVHFTATDKFDKNNGGKSPAVPMLGKWADGWHNEPMEFGYDLTDLGESFDKTKPLKYFFYAKTKTGAIGQGHLYKASIMNYEYDREDPIEIPFKIDTISIDEGGANICVTVVVPGEPLNEPLNATLADKTLTWTSPQATSLPLTKYYIYSSGILVDSTAASRKTYTVNDPNGAYSVAAVYNYKGRNLVSERSNTASKSIVIEKTSNNVLTLNNNSIVIPNAVTKRLNQATIEFMVKANALNGTSNKMGDDEGDFFINISASGQVSSGWSTTNNSENTSTSAGTIKVNKWYHVAVVVNGNELTIYVDGMKKKAFTSATNNGLPAIGDFVIGLDGGEMNAVIDEFRIWKTARTLSEIYGGKDDFISNPSALNDLIAYLPMDLIENEGETKVREYSMANHAYFDNENYTQSTDESILKGSKLATTLAITGVQDTIITGSAIKCSATCPLSTTAWQWSTPGAESNTYTSQAPYIIYNRAGNYTISLTITKADGTTEQTSRNIVVQATELPVASFDIASTTLSSGEAFSFINRSTGTNTTYVWSLPGAQRESLNTTNATAIYDVPGTYTVTLTATNSSGSVSESKTINVVASAPTPDFSVSPTAIFLGETTYLTDKSRGTTSAWTYTVDNNCHTVAINGQNSSFTPKHPGVYDISLTASNEVGQNTIKKKKLLYVSNADPKNALSFTGNERVEFNCPLDQNSKTWSIDWWMNPAQYSGAGNFTLDNGFAKLSGAANGAYKIKLNESTLTSSDGYIILNEWHHYAVTYSLGSIKLYRDGILWESPESKLSYTTGKWEGTMSISDSETPFKGLIDELRIWSKTLNSTGVKTNANKPIANPTAESGLALYYNFNQGQGNVTDQTAKQNDGQRIGFGPDGDAWPLALGVFTIDQDGGETIYKEVTDQYLTNFKAPFYYDKDTQMTTYQKDRYYAIETGTERSAWQTAGAIPGERATTGVYVDTGNGSKFAVATSYTYFNDEISNLRAWQPVILPAGKYVFSHKSDSRLYSDMKDTRIVATTGSELSTNSNYLNALASASILDTKEIEFMLGTDTEVSLGLIYNFASYDRYEISEFQLFHQPIEIIEADGETSIYESIANGHAQEAWGREGGIMIATKEKKNFKIYTVDGQCVLNDLVHGTHFLPFQPGIYIVNGTKVQVK